MSKDLNLTKHQKEVLEAKGSDILVAASAGSGKTFVVVERIINRIVNDNIDIDRVLVVTFTNAAAAELKERILNKFYDILKDKDVTEKKKKHVEKQIKLINRAQISTIHSFCLNIIKNNFYFLKIDPNVKTLDENKAKIMIIESINEVIEAEYEKKSDEFIKALEMFKNEETLISYIEKTYNFSKSMVAPYKWLETAAEKYLLKDSGIIDLSETEFGKDIIFSVKEKLELLQKELENVCNKIIGDKDFESRLKVLETLLEKVEELKMLNKFDDMYTFLKTKVPQLRLPSSKCANEQLKKEVVDIKKKTSDEINNISKIIYMDTKGILEELYSMYPVINWFVNCTKKVDEIYTEKKNITSQIDFNDYEHLALKALQDENIANQYLDKFEEIYIDEYQDTSYIQEMILKTISRNNRIMVGDVKQSIYSFRNAEPRLFNEKYNEYNIYGEEENKTGSKILLSQNFRSRKTVLDSINDVFKRVMSDKVGECDYSEKEYLTYGDGFDLETEKENITEINIVETNAEETKNLNAVEEEIENITDVEKEAHMIAEKIKEIINSRKKIYNQKEEIYRPVEYKDIVILLRSVNNKANIYEEVLKSKGVPAFSDTSDAFYNSQEVSIILSLFKALDNMYDDISLLSIMYSIIGKFTLDDLVVIRSYDKKDYLYNSVLKAYNDKENISKNLYEKIDTFIKLLNKIRVYLSTYTIAETLLYIYEETGIYYSFYLEELGNQKCANLDSLVEIARHFEKEEKSSIYQFINYVENIKDKKMKGGDSPKLIGEGENVVRILTIHKSKGLEYPIVFIANSSKTYNKMDASEEVIFDKKLGIGSDIFNTDIGIAYPSVIKQAIKENIKNRTTSEEERLLYVAMTRAKEKLYIYGTVKNYEKIKNDTLLQEKGAKLSPILVKEANSYLNLLLTALNFESTDTIKINVVRLEKEVKNENRAETLAINRSITPKQHFLEYCKKNEIKAEKIDLEFEKKYNYLDSLDVKKKYSVTELKKAESEDGYSLLEKNANNEKLNKIIPKSLDNIITSTSYGTTIHRILEDIDYMNINEERIKKDIEEKFKEVKGVNVDMVNQKISTYIKGDISQIISNAKYVKKELPFVIYDNLKGIENVELKEATYLQGVIDLFIKTNDNKNIIVDFKTDTVKEEKELIEKYKVQLEIYKRGVELSLNEKVDSLYIYSFHLNKLIKV